MRSRAWIVEAAWNGHSIFLNVEEGKRITMECGQVFIDMTLEKQKAEGISTFINNIKSITK